MELNHVFLKIPMKLKDKIFKMEKKSTVMSECEQREIEWAKYSKIIYKKFQAPLSSQLIPLL